MQGPMEGPGRVLVGFDASDHSVQALRYAAAEAVSLEAELVAVYVADDTVINSAWGVVFDPDSIKATAEELLVGAVELAVELGVPAERVSTRIELGAPAAALAQLSADAVLVVVGRSSGGSRKSFAGSTAVGLAASCKCPLIVVADDGRLLTVGEGDLGVAIDAGGRGTLALEWALENAPRYGNRVKAISVCRAPHGRLFRQRVTPEQIDQAMAETRLRLQELVAPYAARHPGIEIETEVRYGSPVDELVADSDDLELLVVGVQHNFPTYAVGGVVRGVMAHANCPVVLIDSH